MMLSDKDIQEVIANKELIIEPYDESYLRGAGLTLHLGEMLLKPQPGIIVDVKKEILPKYDEIILTEENPYPLKPGEFILGHTFQKVTVGQSLGFFIEGRSTLARLGLTIVQTAMLVYPGHTNRTVTLELANHGPNTILLYPKMKISRVALFYLKSPATQTYDDDGKYRGQELVGKPIFKKEIL